MRDFDRSKLDQVRLMKIVSALPSVCAGRFTTARRVAQGKYA